MTPHHHPAEDLLLQYASGATTEPFALLVAAHLGHCAECRATVAEAEAIGGALLELLPAEPDGDSAIAAQVAAALERAARPETRDHGAASPLRDYLGDWQKIPWQSLGPGIQHSVLARDRFGAVARLLRIAPGRAVFEHTHAGNELTLVLEGGYRAGGVHYQVGDVESADESVTHRPVADAGTACICLAVTDAPLRFRNILGRMMQPFIRI